jgi:acetyl-CoA carboxylase carboxyltransferase component
MEAQIAETAAVAELHRQGGPEASRERHVGRGKLLPRERVAALHRSGFAVSRDRPLCRARALWRGHSLVRA